MHTNVFRLNRDSYDIAIIGGGVNGTAIARDMAGRGYSVILFEADDLASHTSSASTKLIHGGLRYLEYGELRLVKKALSEREVFLNTAPHIVHPMRFVLPCTPHTRPAWMLRVGLKLYDNLARRDILPPSSAVDLTKGRYGAPFASNMTKGFAYSDCAVDDARLVVLQAMDARMNGAHILPRTRVTYINPDNGGWIIETNTSLCVRARMCINAAGPWVHKLLEQNDLVQPKTPHVRLIRGSHIVVPALYEGDHAYLLQQPDGRVVFTIPYEDKFTLIGTTDIEHGDNPDIMPECTDAETEYLCAAINRDFTTQITPADVKWRYSGVRPLFDTGGNASAVTRDYHLHPQTHQDAAILNIYGGKITTCRLLAMDAAVHIENTLSKRAPAWTHNVPLPGGNVVDRNMYEFVGDIMAYFPWMEHDTVERMANAYGTNILYILGNATSFESLGHHFGADLYQAEVDYLIHYEWARTVDDVLWRRSKLGLHIDSDGASALNAYMARFA